MASIMPNSSFVSTSGASRAPVQDQIRRPFVVPGEFSSADAAEFGALSAADRDQLARDYAAIEDAAAALRRAEPALQSWTDQSAATTPIAQKPRPVWLLIGVLWVSTALVTLGAVCALSALVG